MRIRNSLRLGMGLLVLLSLMSGIVAAEIISLETDITIKTYQDGNVSKVKVTTEEDVYDFVCGIDREYNYDIDVLREVTCSETTLSNVSNLIYIMSKDNQDYMAAINTLTTDTTNKFTDCKEQLSTKTTNYNVCYEKLSTSYTTDQYNDLFLNHTIVIEDLNEAQTSRTLWGFGGIVLGGLFVYFMMMRKFPKNPEGGTGTW